jgi:dienelactone hydrolase
LLSLLAWQPSNVVAQSVAPEPRIKPLAGQFLCEGHLVDEFHCEPVTPGKHPIVFLIHGCAPLGFGDDEFHRMCGSLAEHGYYAMFVEYFSRTGQPNCAQFAMLDGSDSRSAMPLPSAIWMREIVDAGRSLANNPRADSQRFGLIGFSTGGLSALVAGALYPNQVKAIVDYYALLTPRGRMYIRQPRTFPPTLILQGDADSHANVSQSIDLNSLLAERGAVHEIHVYPGVEHAFNFQGARGYDPEVARDAWERTLTFLGQHLK